MAPIVVAPSGWDLRDLAAHYAYLPRKTPTSSERVAEGAFHRRDRHAEARYRPVRLLPWQAGYQTRRCLAEGQPLAYLQSQLQACARGERHSDINAVMRNEAGRMTPGEID